jgi:hypothetical protein
VVGLSLPRFTTTVKASRVTAFLNAIGEQRAEYRDRAAAEAASYRGLPVPPTYLFTLELERPVIAYLVNVLAIRWEAVPA